MQAWLLLLCAAMLVVSACSSGNGNGDSAPKASVTASADWPMLGHDVSSSFHNGAETAIAPSNAGRLVEAWTFKTGGSVYGTPAVVDGRVYVLSTAALYALDGATGAVLWRNDAVRGTSSPTYDGGKLYVDDSKSVLHRIDAATGGEEWQAVIDAHPQAFGFSSPVVARGRVIVGSASFEETVAKDNATFRGGLVAFDAATGAEAWRHYTVDPPYNGVSVWSTPSVDEQLGLVFASTGNNYTGEASATSDSVFALDVDSGALRWSTQLSQSDVFTIPSSRGPDSDFGTNPTLFDAVIDGRPRKLAGAGQKSGMFWALDRTTGEVVWSRQVSGGSALIGGVFNNGGWDGERVIVAGNSGTSSGAGSEASNGKSKALGGASITTAVLLAMDPADGAVLWERQLPAWVWAPITIANGVGFVSADSELQAFDVTTGAKLFTLATKGTIASGAAVAGGRVYFGSGLAYLGTTPDDAFHALALP